MAIGTIDWLSFLSSRPGPRSGATPSPQSSDRQRWMPCGSVALPIVDGTPAPAPGAGCSSIVSTLTSVEPLGYPRKSHSVSPGAIILMMIRKFSDPRKRILTVCERRGSGESFASESGLRRGKARRSQAHRSWGAAGDRPPLPSGPPRGNLLYALVETPRTPPGPIIPTVRITPAAAFFGSPGTRGRRARWMLDMHPTSPPPNGAGDAQLRASSPVSLVDPGPDSRGDFDPHRIGEPLTPSPSITPMGAAEAGGPRGRPFEARPCR
jgi:hypothetical protein